ncbi:hypothetical protein [Methylobacterium soli]|uniref:Uncharacterized protein n=1 Tax=Methylobacterium soli TaxID=553447 RepID=A0A6L3SZW5_9HYPH|nr:hypothetical protein [Methylobacterium soli]KAB1079751.1 hypothetical protein F6X53_08235 [Methylobacterium soli]GJE46700.1 hypothetical protein AEGHOMDF_5907 [Methylobacterium soli]
MISSAQATETQIEANTGFETQWSRAETALQGLIGLIIAAGLLGAFGNGWLSASTKAFAHEPLSVTYQHLLRANAPTDLIVDVTRALHSEKLQIDVGSDLLDHASIGATQPSAVSVDATPRGVTYTFNLGLEKQGSITFKLSPRKVGPVAAKLTVRGDQIDLPLFVYP